MQRVWYKFMSLSNFGISYGEQIALFSLSICVCILRTSLTLAFSYFPSMDKPFFLVHYNKFLHFSFLFIMTIEKKDVEKDGIMFFKLALQVCCLKCESHARKAI